MKLDNNDNNTSKKSVAVVGGGVAGLAAAWHLHHNTPHEVVLVEASHRLGGHAWTVNVNNETDVDIGFMVFNSLNYPNMVEWFDALGVQSEASDMSLSVSLDDGNTIEWSSDNPFCKVSNLFHKGLYLCFWDMLKFHKEAPKILLLPDDDPRKHITVSEFLKDYSESFAKFYLLPMMAALWSSSLNDVLQYPVSQLVGFLCNHKMLQLFGRPHWKTVAGRSQQYVTAVQESLGKDRVQLNNPVRKLQLTNNNKGKVQYKLISTNGQELPGVFDDVIFCCHTDTTRDILTSSQLHPNVCSILGDIQYADNIVYVHSDSKLMPQKSAWASWNCLGNSKHLTVKQQSAEAFEGGGSGFGNTLQDEKDNLEGSNGRFKAVYVTYWLNRLQNLATDKNVFVSLNPHHPPESYHHKYIMGHPQFTPKTLAARKNLATLQGEDGLWFAGAWAGYGFHEDGCRSGFQVATQLSGVALPWAKSALVLPPPDLAEGVPRNFVSTLVEKLHRTITYDVPVAICKRLLYYFLETSVHHGTLRLKFNDGTTKSFGDGTPCGSDTSPVTVRVFDSWFFVKTAVEYDLGLARSYMAGYFVVEPIEKEEYHPVLRPSDNETTICVGDPVGLTRLFLLFIGNRDRLLKTHVPKKSGLGHFYSSAFSNASGLLIGKIGSLANYVRYKLTMDNSERGGSQQNIRAHYDLSNDLFRTFLDKETLMYSSAIYDAVKAPSPQRGLIFRGSLEEAQWRKLDTLLDRAQVQPGQTLLDIGFGWGGLSIHAAKKYGCRVTGITLSVEQKALAEVRVREEGLESLIMFEVVDYRTFARRKENRGKFDRVLSCEMIEAVGHRHLGEFFWAVEQVLAQDGILVMEAITTPEMRYETYIRSTDFINTVIFPGSCCPSLHALVDAAYQQSCLTLEHIDNIGLHYAETLAEWRRRFNANESVVRRMGFDDVFLRAWNYYLTYCEAGFFSQTENCLILVFSRQGCQSLVTLCETRSVTQRRPLSLAETSAWVTDGAI